MRGAVARVEDLPLLIGAAEFTEDVGAPGALHAVFVRSAFAHARLLGINAKAAAAFSSVAGVYTAADLGLPPLPPHSSCSAVFARPVLAESVVRFAGEPLAVVVAESRAAAMDAAELVQVDFDPLPVVVDPVEAARADAPLLFPDAASNIAVKLSLPEERDALEGAEVRIRGLFVNQRLAPVPLEVEGAVAIPEPDGSGLTLWTPCQAPFLIRSAVAEALGLQEGNVRVVAPAVGGAFGAKILPYPEQVLVAALALRLDRPVRYTETRTENLVAMTHGRAQIQEVELGATSDGRITGLRVHVTADLGAYPSDAAELPDGTAHMLSGVYDIPRIQFHSVGVVTNTTPVSAYRGAGRPEATALIERAVDMLAAELDMDPADVRRRNFIRRDGFPHTTATGANYDSGDYERALDKALHLADYEEVREEQVRRRARNDPRQLGVGISTYVETTGFGSEYGSVEVHEDGTAMVRTGTSPQGQGHATAFGQIVASTLRVPLERVTVIHSDTGRVPRGEGTMASRSLQVGGSAVLEASHLLVKKAREIASAALETGEADLVLGDGGRIEVIGAPEHSLSWGELARLAREHPGQSMDGEVGLSAEADFALSDSSYPFGGHVAVVEVDTETGGVELLRFVAVDDCGRILNPILVQGQIHGGIVQGIGQGLWEGFEYDESGNPITSNLMTYLMPTAPELPPLETEQMETPTDRNPLGAKGVGESGAVGSTAAIQNSVIDALAHLGVRHLQMPLTPERILRAIHGAKEGRGQDE